MFHLRPLTPMDMLANLQTRASKSAVEIKTRQECYILPPALGRAMQHADGAEERMTRTRDEWNEKLPERSVWHSSPTGRCSPGRPRKRRIYSHSGNKRLVA